VASKQSPIPSPATTTTTKDGVTLSSTQSQIPPPADASTITAALKDVSTQAPMPSIPAPLVRAPRGRAPKQAKPVAATLEFQPPLPPGPPPPSNAEKVSEPAAPGRPPLILKLRPPPLPLKAPQEPGAAHNKSGTKTRGRPKRAAAVAAAAGIKSVGEFFGAPPPPPPSPPQHRRQRSKGPTTTSTAPATAPAGELEQAKSATAKRPVDKPTGPVAELFLTKEQRLALRRKEAEVRAAQRLAEEQEQSKKLQRAMTADWGRVRCNAVNLRRKRMTRGNRRGGLTPFRWLTMTTSILPIGACSRTLAAPPRGHELEFAFHVGRKGCQRPLAQRQTVPCQCRHDAKRPREGGSFFWRRCPLSELGRVRQQPKFLSSPSTFCSVAFPSPRPSPSSGGRRQHPARQSLRPKAPLAFCPFPARPSPAQGKRRPSFMSWRLRRRSSPHAAASAVPVATAGRPNERCQFLLKQRIRVMTSCIRHIMLPEATRLPRMRRYDLETRHSVLFWFCPSKCCQDPSHHNTYFFLPDRTLNGYIAFGRDSLVTSSVTRTVVR
jgi:hypothetical protein